MTDREAFDAFATEINADVRQDVQGWYVSDTTNRLWLAWQAAIKQERETAKLNSHEAFWVENRTQILDAIEKAGFQLMSNQHGFFLWDRARSPSTPVQGES